MIVAFRRHTLLPLDDCLYGLQPSIPHLTRSSLHRCLERHGISRLPELSGGKPKRSKFADYAIGYFTSTSPRFERNKASSTCSSPSTGHRSWRSPGSRTRRRDTPPRTSERAVKAVPYEIHTVLTDNGMQFCHAPRYRSGPTAQYSMHMLDRVCRNHGIEHRLTKPNHPWPNGQVERMNRILKEATVKRYHYETHDQLRSHLQLFVDAHNYERRLKPLRGLTPYEYVC